MTDVPTGLTFVDPTTVQTTYRICLAGEPGDGKTIAAATAPAPILVLNADRPSAWEVARRRNPDKEIRETRYHDSTSLDELFRYLGSPEGADVASLVIDPWSNIYDQLCATAPKVEDSKTHELKPDYEMVNAKLLRFLTALRRFDVHVVIVTHLKENESGKKADGKTYARFGGMGLIRKSMAEMDVIALIQRTTPEDGDPVWFAEIQPTASWAGKDGTDSLGARRIADLSRWVELAREANVAPAGDSDLPWDANGSGAQAVSDGAAPQATAAGGGPTEEPSQLPQATPRGSEPAAGVEAGTTPAGSGDEPSAAPAGAQSDAAAPSEPTPLPVGDAPIDATLAAAQRAADGKPLDSVDMALLLHENDWKLLDLLIAGNTAKDAAAALEVTTDSVRAHCGRIKATLGVNTIVEVVMLAKEMRYEERAEDADPGAIA